jgi:hypothetical protein
LPKGTDEDHESPQSGQPASHPRFEPATSGIKVCIVIATQTTRYDDDDDDDGDDDVLRKIADNQINMFGGKGKQSKCAKVHPLYERTYVTLCVGNLTEEKSLPVCSSFPPANDYWQYVDNRI